MKDIAAIALIIIMGSSCRREQIASCEKEVLPYLTYLYQLQYKEIHGKYDLEDEDGDYFENYRFPNAAELRRYLFDPQTHYVEISLLCKLLMKSDPTNNAGILIEYLEKKVEEYETARNEFYSKKEAIQKQVNAAVYNLNEMGSKSIPIHKELLRRDSDIATRSVMIAMEDLLMNGDLSDEQADDWILFIIDLLWGHGYKNRSDVIDQLLSTDWQLKESGKDIIQMKHWVSLLTFENYINVYESVYGRYADEYEEWENKAGGIRKLIIPEVFRRRRSERGCQCGEAVKGEVGVSPSQKGEVGVSPSQKEVVVSPSQ